MSLVRTAILGSLSLLLVVDAGEAVAQDFTPISAEDLLAMQSAVGGSRSPKWSPDGSKISFISGGRLVAVSPEGGAPALLTDDLSLSGVGSLGAPQPSWSPDGRWIAYTSDKGGAPDIWLWSAEDARDIRLTKLSARATGLAWSPDGRWIAFAGDRFGSMDIWLVSVPDGEVFRLTDDALYEGYPSWTPDGEKLLYVRMDEKWLDHDVIEIARDGGEERVVLSDTDFFDYRAGLAFGAAVVSPDGERVLFRSKRSGWLNYWIAPMQGGEPRQVAAADYDQDGGRWSPDGRSILYTENRDGTHSLRVVASDGGPPRVLVGHDVGAALRPEWSPDGASVSYTFETPTRPADLHVVSVDSGESRRLTSSVPMGLEDRLYMPEKVTYPSTDGLTIQAYLYRPVGISPGKRVPGVMWIHGGPTSQFDDQFRRHQQVHYFVQRGYAVLLPNIRGSSGYGLEFEDLNNECWGHCDLEDVVAGVDYLESLPFVDADKIGVTGTSYGGMMTMFAVAFAPDVFQAAISLSGYGDMTDFHSTVHELQHIKLVEYELGPYPENEAVYRRSSPILKAHQVTTPTFVIQGEGVAADWRLPEGEPHAALKFARKLDQQYKIVRYKSYENEGYYVYGRQNTIEKLRDMEDFFEEFLRTDIRYPRGRITDLSSRR